MAVERLRLGGVPSMQATPPSIDRPIDVLFMGGLDDRRGAALAELAPHLWRRHTDIRLVGGDRPIHEATPQTVFGAEKYALLSSAKLLLNIHRDRPAGSESVAEHPPYFEWARAVEAMAQGCVVITEPSEGCEPLMAGTHFVEATVDEMAGVIDELLDDEPRRADIAAQAHRMVFGELALENSLAPLLDRIESEVLPHLGAHASSRSVRQGSWRLGLSQGPHPVRLGPFRPFLPTLVTAKRIAMAENAALQRLDAAACELTHGSRQHIVQTETPAYADADPEVSVVVSLYNYAAVVTDTLASIAASEGVRFEIIVVEDHATDDSRAVVQRFIDDHPTVPMTLLAKDANQGLAAARNAGFDHARAPLVMVMDADNMIYPTCLRKLADALERPQRCRCRLRHPRRLRRSTKHPQRGRVGCRSSVPGQLHRRPGDAAQERMAAPRRLPGRRRPRLRLGGLGPVAAVGRHWWPSDARQPDPRPLPGAARLDDRPHQPGNRRRHRRDPPALPHSAVAVGKLGNGHESI